LQLGLDINTKAKYLSTQAKDYL